MSDILSENSEDVRQINERIQRAPDCALEYIGFSTWHNAPMWLLGGITPMSARQVDEYLRDLGVK